MHMQCMQKVDCAHLSPEVRTPNNVTTKPTAYNQLNISVPAIKKTAQTIPELPALIVALVVADDLLITLRAKTSLIILEDIAEI